MSTVERGRKKNESYRKREYLTEHEIGKLLATAGKSRNPNRDRLLVLMAYRHALRVKELVDLQVDQIDLKAATIHIRRAKNGTPGIHGLQGDELRLIRALVRENGTHCRYLFISERGAPLSIDGAQKLIERLGETARLPFPIHIRRAKNGTPGIHGLQGDELRLIRALVRENGTHCRYLFISERGAPLSIDGAQKLIERLGETARLPFPIHIHMLRHSAGYALAGRGVDTRTLQAFMGHRSISNTVVYTAVADKRLRNIWQKR